MPSSRVYVGGLSPKVRQSELEALFGDCGRVTRCDFKARPDSAFAFFEFETPRGAERAIKELDGHMLSGTRLLVESARNKYQTQGTVVGGQVRRQDCRVIVDDLPSHASWQDLKDFAREGGNVVYADVYSDRGIQRGVVEFDSKSNAQAAVRRLDGRRMQGVQVLVREELHVKPSPNPPRYRSPPRGGADHGRHRNEPEEHVRRRLDSRNGRGDHSLRQRSPIPGGHHSSRRRMIRSRSRSPNERRSPTRRRSMSPHQRRLGASSMDTRRHNGGSRVVAR